MPAHKAGRRRCGGGAASASGGDGEAGTGGGVGYGAVYQAGLRKLLAGDAYAEAEDAYQAGRARCGVDVAV